MSEKLSAASKTPPIKISPEFIAHAFSQYLTPDNQKEFLRACATPLRPSVRVNTLKYSVEQLQRLAAKHQWRLLPIPWCEQGFWIDTQSDSGSSELQGLGNLAAHVQGAFYIQEASSMLPPAALFFGEPLLNAQDGMSELVVMDMAAAPGSKTTQIAALLNNQGVLLANELSASRLKSLHANLLRCGVINTCLSHLDGRKIGAYMPAQFDYVLLDAPCGGEGTIRKDNLALSNWRLEQVESIAQLQKEMILSAYQSLKPGGKLVYSTCTLSFEENHQVVDFLIDNTDAQVEPLSQLFDGAEKAVTEQGYLHVLPHLFDSEGFFVAKIKKPINAETADYPQAKYNAPFIKLSKKLKQQFTDYLAQYFGIDITQLNLEILQRDKEIWIFPKSISKVNLYLKINRAGTHIAQIFPKKIRITHEFASCFGHLAKKQVAEINAQQASEFIQGKNFQLESNELENGDILLKFEGLILGIGLNQKGKVKNGLPRALVRDNLVLNASLE